MMFAAAAAAQPFQHEYTTCADFTEGTLTAVDCGADSLFLSSQVTTLPVMWIANAGEDTVSKWDTDLNKEVARYHTWVGPRGNHGYLSGPAPSRTAVDLDGNVYVANRHFDGRPASVMKILNDGYIDRNGNGVMDTSFDASNDGVIQPNEEIIHVDDNGNGVLSNDEIEDERVAWITQVGSNGCLGRCLAIDANGDIWVGLHSCPQLWKLDGDTGAIVGGPYGVSCGLYGAFVDRDGILWGATLAHCLVKFDTNTNAQLAVYNPGVPTYTVVGQRRDPGDGNGPRTFVILGNSALSPGYRQFDSFTNTFSTPAATTTNAYGYGVDGDGNIFTGSVNSARAIKYNPTGGVVWDVNTGTWCVSNRTTIADSNGHAWRISVDQSRMQKLDGATGSSLGGFTTGLYPYTYSDATGLGLRQSFPQGTWVATYDSGCNDTCWDNLSWTDYVPQDTSITVRARSSNDQTNWSAYETASNGVDFASIPNGRYLEFEVKFQVLAGDESPVLYDLTVHGELPAIAADIHPGRTPNRIFLSRNYTIYVLCYGNGKVDVTQLDWTAARFGPTGTEALPIREPTIRDYDGDGYMDGLFGFRTFDCGFSLGDTQGILTINSVGGCPMSAADSVLVAP